MDSFIRILVTLLTLYLPTKWLATFISRQRNARNLGCVPPPSLPQKDPIFGLDLVFRFFSQSKQNHILKDIQSTIKQYGTTYSSSPFGRRTIQTIEPRNIQSVFATNIESYEIGYTRGRSTKPLLGEGIMGAEGARWKVSRNLIQPTFARADMDLDGFGKHVRLFLDKLPKDGSSVDLAPLFANLILDSSSEFVFGESVSSQISNQQEHEEFLHSFDVGKQGISALFFLSKLDFLYRSQDFRDACKTVNDWTQRRIDKIYSRLEQEKNDLEKSKNYVLGSELVAQSKSSSTVRGELLNVYFAGHDSPAIALTSIMFEVARHPDVWEKTRHEVLQVGDVELTFDRLKSLKYIHWVVNETLRLHPVVPSNTRICTKPAILPLGGGTSGKAPVYMHPGDKIQMNFYTLHRSPKYFGSDAHLFRPERWEHLRPTWEFVPFGGGPRICPAQQLSRIWITYVLVLLAREFKEVANKDPVEEFVEMTRLSLQSGNGAIVGLIPV